MQFEKRNKEGNQSTAMYWIKQCKIMCRKLIVQLNSMCVFLYKPAVLKLPKVRPCSPCSPSHFTLLRLRPQGNKRRATGWGPSGSRCRDSRLVVGALPGAVYTTFLTFLYSSSLPHCSCSRSLLGATVLLSHVIFCSKWNPCCSSVWLFVSRVTG